ncbi:MAG TPA: ABC transporter ATP-binding protein [Gammaproteobacteria bacterium]|nr:ABC transporter ATP-binding protein [Gammaproteobacteria bacterium]
MIIETHDLTKRFGKHDAVSGVSLGVPEGATLALIGANGAGKTTTLRMLMNLLRADAGEARVLGVDSRRLTAREYSRIGYVSESQELPARLTTEQFFAYLRPLYSTWDRTVEDDLRRRFELQPAQKLGQLSHGMRMKVRLAAALPHRPALLVLDEPLSGLDVLVRDEVMGGLLAHSADTTVLISSHELAEIEGCATHIAFMDKGRLVIQDSLEDVATRFREVTAGFVSDPKVPARLPEKWLTPEWSGRTLRFTTIAYAGDEELGRALASLVGPLAHLSAEPMSLRDTSKALIRAYRKEAA